MKFFLITIIFLSLIRINAFSQVNQQWVSTYSGPGNGQDRASSMAVDASGNVYVTGNSIGIGTGIDYATVKYNPAGVQQWAARYNGEGGRDDYATAIAVDGAGNVYVTGWSNKSASGNDYATIKYNSAGDSLWVRRYSGVSGSFNDDASSLAIDSRGNVYVTGASVNGVNIDIATIKYNSAGTQVWVSRYDGPGAGSDAANAIAVDPSGNVYVTGISDGIGTGLDYVTIKYDSTGVQQWASRYYFMLNLADISHAIVVDASGNVYITGQSAGSGSGTGNDYATIKYNSSGVQQWVSRYDAGPSDYAYSIGVDGSGNVFVTGSSIGIGTMEDYATIKYNSSGVQQWVRRYDGPTGNVSDIAHSLAVDNLGNVYVTGESNQNGVQYYQYATIKYNTSGDSVWVRKYDGVGNGHDRAHAIATDVSGNVYVTGESGAANDYATIKYSQFSNALITGFIQAFYNSSTNKMVSDTVRIYLRNSVSPYIIIDSSRSKLDSSGMGSFYFSNAVDGINYYIVLKHRNSIETWSSSANAFSSGTLNYDFTASANKAYGSNQIQVDTSPLRFAIYSGDRNQDGIVDVTDIAGIYNDANNFVSGYVSSDMNGDNFVDVTDLVITYNNSIHFVAIIRP